MKRLVMSVAVLATLLTTGCSRTAVQPDQPTETSVLFGARASSSAQSALPASVLPATVKTYLDQNYAGYTLIRVEKMPVPGTTASIITRVTILQGGVPVDLFFDQNGASTTRPAGPRGEIITRLTAAQLPASVSSYLSQTYAGYQLVAAESMKLNSTVQEYRVQILANNQRLDIHFDGTGTFRDAHTAPSNPANSHSVLFVARTSLSAAIQTALSSTYAPYTYGWAEQHIHDGTTTYDVKLFKANQPVVLHFDTSGALVAPVSPKGGVVGGPMSGTLVAPAPKPGTPSAPASGTVTIAAPAAHQIILVSSQLPTAISAFLQAKFSGYTFLAADVHTPPKSTGGEYVVDLAIGQQLYKLRFNAAGDLLMAEARG